MTIKNTQSEIMEGQAYFDSNTSYLTTPDSDDWYLDGDFTIEFWFYKKNDWNVSDAL